MPQRVPGTVGLPRLPGSLMGNWEFFHPIRPQDRSAVRLRLQRGPAHSEAGGGRGSRDEPRRLGRGAASREQGCGSSRRRSTCSPAPDPAHFPAPPFQAHPRGGAVEQRRGSDDSLREPRPSGSVVLVQAPVSGGRVHAVRWLEQRQAETEAERLAVAATPQQLTG